MDKITEFLKESNAIEDIYDDASLRDAERAWEYLIDQDVLTLPVILEVHRILMKSQTLEEKYKGKFRDIPVYIGGKMATQARLIGPLMWNWAFEMMAHGSEGDETRSRFLHVRYEKIHPFADGNGRTGRMFMNWWRLRNELPLLIIHTGKEQYAYYKWFD